MIKKRYAFLFLFFLTCFAAFGQKKLSLSATVAPAFTNISYNNRYFYPESDGQIVEPVYLNGKKWATGFITGLTVQYTYAPGWSVATGVWYVQQTIRQPRLAAAGEGTMSIRNRALRVPILLNYRSSTERLSPYFTIGLAIDFPFVTRVIADRSGEPTQNLRLGTARSPLFQPVFGAGAQYQLTPRYQLMLQPIWTYNLGRFSSTDSRNPSNELSLLAQITYSF
ncbi:PorT family protein [Spirosoma soli]|uniref:PorT family protein n=1 Tax=Spirosoma soli TaxID=1770529 RepID=A0ABW5M0V4_9BACT